MTLKESLALCGSQFIHSRKCEGTITYKETDPETQKVTKIKVPCSLCAHFAKRMAEIPMEFLSECLTEAPPPRATFSLATLIVESTFERGTHKSKRGQRDLIAGMKILKWYQDNGGKLNVSH